MISSLLSLFISCSLIMVRAEWKFSTININVSDSCKEAILRLSELEVRDPQLMAYYLDSWGKPSDGILTGHTTFLGNYDECIDMKNTALGETKYCIYSMIMEINTSLSDAADSGVCLSNKCPAPVNVSSVTDIKVGICYPSQCSPTEFVDVLSTMAITNVVTMITANKMSSHTIKLKSTGDSPASCPDTDVELDRGAVAVIIVCGLFIGLVIVGTIMDYLLWLPSSNKPLQKVTNEAESVQTITKNKDATISFSGNRVFLKELLLSFSLYNNIPKLVSTKQSPSTIKGLNAIKILFNVLIVTSHLHFFAFAMFPSASQNSPKYLHTAVSRFIFQPIMSVDFSVDAFFLASATLSAYLTFKDMEKHKKFRCIYFYLKRFLRLSPMYYLFTFIVYKLSVHFGQGPVWFSQDYHACANSWWYNLLYLNNILSPLDSCMLATWHICVDMQVFIFSPIFIIILYHSLYYGVITIAVTMIAATTTVGLLAAKNGYWAAIFANPQLAEQTTGLYYQPFYRINTYLTGILLGYVLYKKYNIATLPIQNWLKQLIYFALWSMAIYLCTVSTLFGTYGEYNGTHHFTDFENITFLMFSGLQFSIGLSIIIYICNTGYGDVFSSFLSWPGWDPISRLTYSVFLIHQMVIFYILGTLRSSLNYTDVMFTMISVFSIVMSFSLSMVIMVFVELPIANVVSLAGIEARSK